VSGRTASGTGSAGQSPAAGARLSPARSAVSRSAASRSAASRTPQAKARGGAAGSPSKQLGRRARIASAVRRPPRLSPTFAAVTAASIGVTGAVGGGALLSGDHLAAGNNLVLSDVHASGVLAGAQTRTAKPTPTATPRYTTRTVTPTPTASMTQKAEPATGRAVLDRTDIERMRAEERASRARERLALSDPKQIAAQLVADKGWSDDQFECLDVLWEHESGWRVDATNPSSGAYGIPQALPGEKMASHGSDWQTNPRTQIEWGLDYIASRYSTPCGAWSYWQAHNWY
jgi:hypothetical protein